MSMDVARRYEDEESSYSGLFFCRDELRRPCRKRVRGRVEGEGHGRHPFEITLSSGGAAKATRGEGMTGTWKEEGNSAVITWNTGWTTKITKEGNRYQNGLSQGPVANRDA